MSQKLGEMLVANKVISEAQLARALSTQKQVGGKLGIILAKLRMVSEEQLTAFLATQLKLPVLGLKELVMHPDVSSLVDVELLERHQLLPIQRTHGMLLVAVADPLDFDGVDNLVFVTGLLVETALASRGNIIKAIDYYCHGRPCPEIETAEKKLGIKTELSPAAAGTRAAPQAVLQAVVELLIEKKIITRQELLAKLSVGQPKKGSK